jgi:hypothetical protein
MSSFFEIANMLAGRWLDVMWPVVWQSTVLAATVYLLTLCIRRASAAVRFWLWMLVPLRLLVMPLITISLPLLPAVTQPESAYIAPVPMEMVTASPPEIVLHEQEPPAEEFVPMRTVTANVNVVSNRVWPNTWALLMAGGWRVSCSGLRGCSGAGAG